MMIGRYECARTLRIALGLALVLFVGVTTSVVLSGSVQEPETVEDPFAQPIAFSHAQGAVGHRGDAGHGRSAWPLCLLLRDISGDLSHPAGLGSTLDRGHRALATRSSFPARGGMIVVVYRGALIETVKAYDPQYSEKGDRES